MEISSKGGSQKAPELPLDLTLIMIDVGLYILLAASPLHVNRYLISVVAIIPMPVSYLMSS